MEIAQQLRFSDKILYLLNLFSALTDLNLNFRSLKDSSTAAKVTA